MLNTGFGPGRDMQNQAAPCVPLVVGGGKPTCVARRRFVFVQLDHKKFREDRTEASRERQVRCAPFGVMFAGTNLGP